MREARELQTPTHMYHAQPVEVRCNCHESIHVSTDMQDNLFEWHFTVRGADDSDFAGGIYHGRITLPSEYPMKPPSIVLLTVRLSIFLFFNLLPTAAERSLPDENENLSEHQWLSSGIVATVMVK